MPLQKNNALRNRDAGNRIIFFVYILSFPFELMPFLNPIKEFFGKNSAFSNTFFIFLLGLVVFVATTSNKKKMPPLILQTLGGVIVLSISSFIMASILNSSLGILWGETTFDCIIPRIIFYMLIPVVLLYNYYGLQTVTKEDLINLFFAYSTMMLIVAYVQLFMIWGLPIAGIYDSLDFFRILTDSRVVLTGRVMSVTGEPSYLVSDLGTVIFPFLCTCNIMNIKKRLTWLHIVLYIPIIYWTKSSALFMVVSAIILAWIYYKFLTKSHNKSNMNKPIIIILAVTMLLIIISCVYNIPIVKDTFDKVFDTNNMSTAFRYSTVINDIKIFFRYPLLGCGNGIQGFFYNENCPDWAYFSYETQNSLNGYNGVLNGGAFFPAYISGFGIFGLILLLLFLRKCIKIASSHQKKMGFLYYMYMMGLIAFLINGTVNVSIDGAFQEIFVLSLPLCAYSEKLMADNSCEREKPSYKPSKFIKKDGRFDRSKS